MENKFTKRYYENYAMLSLERCYDKSWNCFSVSGDDEPRSPDLQSDKLNIGVEVTQVLLMNQGVTNKIAGTYFGKQCEPEFIKNEVSRCFPKFKKYGGQLDVMNGTTAISHSAEGFTTKEHFDKLSECILGKTINKLNNGKYRLFTNNHLYLFAHFDEIDEDYISQVMKEIDDKISNMSIKYDMYFINCIDKLFVVNRNSGVINKINIGDQIQQFIKNEAMTLTHGLTSE